MSDAACFQLLFNLAIFIGLIVFYRTMLNAAKATVILSCGADHGHGQVHELPCACKCHVVTTSK